MTGAGDVPSMTLPDGRDQSNASTSPFTVTAVHGEYIEWVPNICFWVR